MALLLGMVQSIPERVSTRCQILLIYADLIALLALYIFEVTDLTHCLFSAS